MKDDKDFELEEKILKELNSQNYKADLDFVASILYETLINKEYRLLDNVDKYKNLPKETREMLERYSIELFMGICVTLLSNVKGKDFMDEIVDACKDNPNKKIVVAKDDTSNMN